jgi:hypothetical protein
MPQHLWVGGDIVRMCEVCTAIQRASASGWTPPVSPICSGDPDDDGGRRRSRPKPVAPSGAPRVLEVA